MPFENAIFKQNIEEKNKILQKAFLINNIHKLSENELVIHIRSGDTINPVVNELRKLYKNAVYKKNSLEKDIRIILGSTNILYSMGSFIPSLMLLSNNNKYLHDTANNNGKLKEYFKIMKPWKNTIEQRNYILTYDYN